tara:strand:- start:874 stop:1017 length:144 start_codon:yes stop_codon:yes gene_type:complete
MAKAIAAKWIISGFTKMAAAVARRITIAVAFFANCILNKRDFWAYTI